PPPWSGSTAYVDAHITPQWGVPSWNAGACTGRLAPSVVREPSGAVRTIIVWIGIGLSFPAAALRAAASALIASESRGEFLSANPMNAYSRRIVTATAIT